MLTSGWVLVATNTLDDFKENCWSIAHWLGEHLKEDTLVILVRQKSQSLQFLQLSGGQHTLANARGDLEVVIMVGGRHEIEASHGTALLHLAHGVEDIIGLQRDVLHTSSVVVLQKVLNLRLSWSTKSWLVHWEQNELVVVRQDHRVQTTVNSSNIVRSEFGELVESSSGHQIIHRLEQLRHIVDNMIDTVQTDVVAASNCDGFVVGQSRAIEFATQEAKNSIAKQLDFRNCARLSSVATVQNMWGKNRNSTVLNSTLVGRSSIIDTNGDGANRISVLYITTK